VTRPDWSADELLKPWRRGRLDLPFTTRERTPDEQVRRLVLFLLATGAIITVMIFAVLVAAGMVPEIWVDPKVTARGPDRWLPYKVALGASAVGMLVLAAVLGPMLLGGSGRTALGRPWTFTATEDGLAIAETAGETFQAPWAEWRLAAYSSAVLYRGVTAITGLTLALGERTFEIDLLRVPRQRALLRAVAQRVAV